MGRHTQSILCVFIQIPVIITCELCHRTVEETEKMEVKLLAKKVFECVRKLHRHLQRLPFNWVTESLRINMTLKKKYPSQAW